MGRHFPQIVVLLFFAGLVPAQSQQISDPLAALKAPNHVIGYTAWDHSFLYMAVQVNKPTLSGTSSAPFSDTLKDDALLIFLQTDDSHAITSMNNSSVLTAVSAAGGIQLYRGDNLKPLFSSFRDFTDQLQALSTKIADPAEREKERTDLLGKIIKYQVEQHGISRDTGTSLPGYTVELAIPWEDIGVTPTVGMKLGFEVAAQSITPDSPALQSFVKGITDKTELYNPSLWGTLLLTDNASAEVNGVETCPLLTGVKPVIDGKLSPGEWQALTAFNFGGSKVTTTEVMLAHTDQSREKPTFSPKAPGPLLSLSMEHESSPRPFPAPHKAQPLPPLTLALYTYNFQADPRSASPQSGVTRSDGSSILVHHPLDGSGPWFSYNSANWQMHQAISAREAGIDALIVDYSGDLLDPGGYANKGLSVLTTSLEYLRSHGGNYPMIGLYLDLASHSGEEKTIATDHLYSVIRDFYRHIPSSFRFEVPLSAANGGGLACPIFLVHSSALKETVSNLTADLRIRFEKDFHNTDLFIIGSEDFRDEAGMDGFFNPDHSKSSNMSPGGWMHIASISPGYDPTFVDSSPDALKRLVSRRDGKTYQDGWNQALLDHPDWVFLSGWDDFSTASEVGPSLESGYSASDITKANVRRRLGLTPLAVCFLKHTVPATILPGEKIYATVRLENIGVESWANQSMGTAPVALAIRWLQNAHPLGYAAPIVLSQLIKPGEAVTIPVQVDADLPDGKPMKPGDYTLEIGLIEAAKGKADQFLSANNPSGVLRIPITIADNQDNSSEWRATLLHSNLPEMMESGSVYSVRGLVRNDGTGIWSQQKHTRISLYIYRTEEIEDKLVETPVDSADASDVLTQDVAPGKTIGVDLTLPLEDVQGKPIPVWNQGDNWSYTIRWQVEDSSGKGALFSPTPVCISRYDFGPSLSVNSIPNSLPAGKRLPIFINVKNEGPQIWLKGAVQVGYHWYYMDGTEYTFNDETTPIPYNMAPGASLSPMLVWVTAPLNDGLYYLEIDLKAGDTWGSTTAASRVGDTIVLPVHVVQGQLTFLDLSASYNSSGATSSIGADQSGFDSKGDTFPVSLLPSYVIDTPIPGRIWLPALHKGPQSGRRISFQWGEISSGSKEFISCEGQKILLGKQSQSCTKLHLLAASTDQDAPAQLGLTFQEPVGTSEDLLAFTVYRWDEPLTHPNSLAYLCSRHNSSRGPAPGALGLYHIVIPVSERKKLISIRLPNNPSIKIAAITLEK